MKREEEYELAQELLNRAKQMEDESCVYFNRYLTTRAKPAIQTSQTHS
jgi:hypothetical protein